MSIYLGNTPLANTGYDKANTDLSNLTNTGKNIANWSNNVTNCITEIPQDIKLELNNGTLTLKAGSKVYVPNGSGVFDVVTIESDFSQSSSSPHTSGMILPIISGSICIGFEIFPFTLINSGSTDTGSGTHIWYDTSTNLIKMYNAGTLVRTDGLPVAIFTGNGTSITSIDQIFNGFGYIGSTVFALPGVKGLIPNGRNADGSLKNIEFETRSVLTITMSGNWTDQLSINLKGSALYTTSTTKYYEDDNKVIDSNGYASDTAFIGSLYYNNGNISNFISKTAFHALDYSDSSTISGWSMPSSRYIDLTLGASGATYTAPANGYINIAGYTTGIPNEIRLENAKNYMVSYASSPSSNYLIGANIEVSKGDIYKVWYNGITKQIFRFIYAEGDK